MIICLGTTPTVQRTLTFARLELDAVNRATDVREFASGKSVNVARVLHAIAQPALATGFLGGDPGRFVRADLDRAGVAHDFVDVEPTTRTCVTVIDEAARTATELIEESKPVEAAHFRALLSKLADLLGRASALVLSGTLPPGAPPRFYADCVSLAASSVPVILDARGEPLDWALERRPSVVKINREELAHTLDADVDDEDAVRGAMRQMVVRGARWVVVTAGTRPTYLTDGRRFHVARVPEVETVNPIGSGDAFGAGLSAGLSRGQDVPESIPLAIACGAANAMTAHAGHVRREDVDRLVPQVKLDPT
jgi:tagatose 6-phosphate kinase